MTDGPGSDAVGEALRAPRDEFVANNPWPFLVGEPVVHTLRVPSRTLVNSPALRRVDTLAESTASEQSAGVVELVAVAVRKRQDVFPEMITIGRTANNDVVIPDATVSKFHAFTRMTTGAGAAANAMTISDAGSRNGTRVMGRMLVARQPAPITLGARIKFGSVELVLRDAAATWDVIRKHRR